MGLAGFIVFVSVEWLYQISDYIIRNRVGFEKLLIFVFYNLPYFTFLGIPVGILFSIFWVISDMYTNREISALLVHGISSKRLVTPFIILAVILGFFSWILGDYIVPVSNYKSSKILNQYIFQSPEVVVKTNTLVELEKDVYFYVKEHNKEKGELYDVVLFRNEEGNEQILTAKKVEKRKDGWYLLNGSMYVVELESGFLKLDMQFMEMKLDIAGEIEQMLSSYKTTRDKTSKELREQLETYKKLGINSSSLVVELQQRYANSLGALVIVLIGLPLSLLFGFNSKSWNIILTFLVVVLYQGSGAWLSGMGKEGIMDPVLATWLPNIIFATVGIVLYLLLDTPIAYKLREFLSRLFIIFILIAAFSTLTSTVGFSQENLIKIQALDTYFTSDSVLLKGEITIIWDKYKLLCDEASVSLEENKVKFIEAKGNVKFYDEDRLYLSNSLKYEFETERVIILNAKTIYNYNYKNKKVPIYVYSSEVYYDSSNTSEVPISLEGSYITTCSLDTPHYMILSSHVYVLENNYIIATNSFLVVLGIPIFPYPLFVTALDGTPPYSFSIIFSQGITINQSFAFTVNNWDIGLSFSNTGNTFKFQDKVTKNNKVIYDEAKEYIEFTLLPITYKYSKGNIYYKFDGPLYFEGNYISSSNFYQRIGLNLQNQYLFFRPVITYDGRLTDTIIQLSGNIRNISYNFFDNHTLRINSIDSNFRLQTDGYINLERPYNLTYQNSYSISLFNNNIGYNLSLYGNKTLATENENINYTYLLPWSWKLEPFSIDFQYQFLIKGLSNISNDVKKQTVGMSDRYIITGTYSLGPFKLTSQWEQVYNFIDEATSNNRNNLKISFDVTTPNVRISNVRNYDILKNIQLPDNVTISTKQPLGDLELSNSITFSYDNINNKLGNENISFGLNSKILNAQYTLQFTIQPNKPIETYIHSIRLNNFTVTAYQQTDYIRNLTANGVFDLFDYKTTLRANYSQSSKIAEPKWNFSYTMEKKDEKYVLSYNTDGKNNYKFEASVKNIDPQLVLGLTYNPSSNSIDYLSLNLDKSLHCWRLNFGLELVNRNTGNFFDNISKVSFKFYLTDIDDKFFLIEPSSGKFEVGGL